MHKFALAHSPLVHNVISLYSIQVARYVLPLITVPYILHTLGPDRYGALAFAQGFVGLIAMFIDYGFSLSATRRISVERGNLVSISLITSSVWLIKALFAGVGLLVIAGLVKLIPHLNEEARVIYLLYVGTIASIFFPAWLFQGIERMPIITAISLSGSILSTVMVFVLVHTPEDYMLVALLQTSANAWSGLLGLLYTVIFLKIRPSWPGWRYLRETFREGHTVFLIIVFKSLYDQGNAFILGLLSGPTMVAYYSASEKIVRATIGLFGPISQSLYPLMSRVVTERPGVFGIWIRRALLILGGLGFLLSGGILIGAPRIVTSVMGPDFIPAISVLRVLSVLPLLYAINNVLGTQVMLPLGKDRAAARIVLSAGAINVIMSLLLAPRYGAVGMATAVITSELSATLMEVLYFRRKRFMHLLFTNATAAPSSETLNK